MAENDIATVIVDAAYKIHTALGPGILESVEKTVLVYKLRKRGLTVLCEGHYTGSASTPAPPSYNADQREIAPG